jgi:hypothetical protein
LEALDGPFRPHVVQFRRRTLCIPLSQLKAKTITGGDLLGFVQQAEDCQFGVGLIPLSSR